MEYEKTTADRVKAPDYVDRETLDSAICGLAVLFAVFLIALGVLLFLHMGKTTAMEERLSVLEEIVLDREEVQKQQREFERWQK